MPLARLWWLLDRNCDLVHTEITENTEKQWKTSRSGWGGSFVLSMRVVKVLGIQWLRIVKNDLFFHPFVTFLVFLHPN